MELQYPISSIQDQRVRFAWHPKFSQSIDYWTEKAAKFDAFVSTEFLTENDADLYAVKVGNKEGIQLIIVNLSVFSMRILPLFSSNPLRRLMPIRLLR